MGAVGGGEPGQPAGSPTSGTSALEKNNSGILFNRQTGSSKICTEPMGRWMACNSGILFSKVSEWITRSRIDTPTL